MRVTFYGAAGEVTGSAYYIQTGISSILLDFGVFQGGKAAEFRNRRFPAIDPSRLDAVIITHAHLDHTGRLPLLVKNGYRNPVYASPATIDVTRLILLDSAKVEEMEIKRMNRKRERKGLPPLAAEFSKEDVENVIKLMVPIPYNQPVEIAKGVLLRGHEAGHILGSMSMELTLTANGKKRVLVFSGDLGPHDLAIINDPVPFYSADMVFMESTYGNRDHKPLEATLREGAEIVLKAIERESKILVPSFAVGRTQQLLFYLARAEQNRNLPPLDVYLDSPMAIEATKLYLKHKELFDKDMLELYNSPDFKGNMSEIHISESAEDSMALNDVRGPCMIIAGAGMCNAGRILHHLKHNLWHPDTSVIFVGYQAEGTLGRRLVDGAEKVRIFGEEIMVKAQIATMGGLSAHAGQSDLLKWFGAISPSNPKLVLTHGEEKARNALAEKITERFGIKPIMPQFGDTIEL